MATALATGRERGKQEGRKEGRQEGRWEEKIAMILRLAQMGLGIGEIAQGADLPINKVQEIIKVHGKTAAIT
jgi:predicted transposase/invertase (TIGR01784 family)